MLHEISLEYVTFACILSMYLKADNEIFNIGFDAHYV